jgi:exonuclease SbcC
MISKITLKNFRGHKETTLEFGPNVNKLIGPNEAGKTTVGHAIAFAFYGTDLFGNSNPDHLINFEHGSCEVIVATDKAIFHRSKKRGATSIIKVGRIGIPLETATQTNLTKLIGLTPEVFISCFSVGHFMRLDSKKQMEVVSQIASVDRSKLLRSLIDTAYADRTLPTCVKLERPLVDAANVATERRKIQNVLSADQGALVQVEAILADITKDAGNQNESELNQIIATLQAKKDLHTLYSQELSIYKVALARHNMVISENERKQNEAKRVLAEIALAKSHVSDISNLVEAEKLCKQSLEQNNQYLAVNTKAPPSVPKLPEIREEATCSRCGQVVPEKLRESVLSERETLLNNYNAEARDVATHNQVVKEKYESEKKEIELKLISIKERISISRSASEKIRFLESQLLSLEQQLTKEPSPPTKPDGDDGTISKELQEYSSRLHHIKVMRERYESTVSKKKELSKQITERFALAEYYASLESALKRMPEEEVKLTLSMLAVDEALVNLVDGQLQVTDLLSVPYQCLSTGRQMKTDFQLAVRFQELLANSGKGVPQFYFLDNADLVDNYKKYLPPVQVFVAEVNPTSTELEVLRL